MWFEKGFGSTVETESREGHVFCIEQLVLIFPGRPTIFDKPIFDKSVVSSVIFHIRFVSDRPQSFFVVI